MTVYRVVWKKGQPYIEHGVIVVVGTKKKIRKIKWPSEEKNKEFSSGFNSIKEAIESDIFDIASYFGDRTFLGRENKHANAWNLAMCINRNTRLYRKLKRHNLV